MNYFLFFVIAFSIVLVSCSVSHTHVKQNVAGNANLELIKSHVHRSDVDVRSPSLGNGITKNIKHGGCLIDPPEAASSPAVPLSIVAEYVKNQRK